MARGGYRPGGGRPKGSKSWHNRGKSAASAKGPIAAVDELELLPLEHLLRIVRDEKADPDRRDRAAIAALPYVHARAEKGKKQQARDRAGELLAAGGKFAPAQAPLAPSPTRKLN